MFSAGPGLAFFAIAPLLSLIPLLLVGLVVYVAVRFGVRHGMRDAQRPTYPPPGAAP